MMVYFNTHMFSPDSLLLLQKASVETIILVFCEININHAQMKNKLYTNKTMADLKAFKNIANMIH